MSLYAHIVQDSDTCFGMPRIQGTRIRVIDVAIEHERIGRTPDQIVESHPGITLSQVHAALAYYYDYLVEMDEAIAADPKRAEKAVA